MKVAPILRALRARSSFEVRFVNTGQHYDAALAQVFFDDLDMPRPDVDLGVGSASHALQTAEIMRRFEPVLQTEQPQVVLVVGDINSTLACALVASKFQLAKAFTCRWGQRTRPLIVHVEAGLRSFDPDMPEEVNRKLTDVLSDLLFVSEPSGLHNLAREGAPDGHVFLVGNVMIDSLLAVRAKAEESRILETLGLKHQGYAVLTLHRPSNVDSPEELRDRLSALEPLAARFPLVFPVHPRTRSRLEGLGFRLEPPRWRPIEPLGYIDFVKLLGSARVVVTDSGGIQEETTVLGVPCVTLRENTERPATLEQGTNVLAGTSVEGIRRAIETATADPRPSGRRPDLWDGSTAGRIVDVLEGVLQG